MAMKIEGVFIAQVKSVSATEDTCIVRMETKPGTIQPFHYVNMTFRAFTALCNLTADIDGAFDVELLQYSEKDSTLVTDVIVISN